MGFFGHTHTDAVVEMAPGDMLICYTDGLSEAADPAGRHIGDDLPNFVRTVSIDTPMAAGAALLGLVDQLRKGEPVQDDETLIVIQRPAAVR